MATPRQVIELLKRKIEAKPAAAESIGTSYRFELEGEGGGNFLLNLKPPAGVVEVDDAGRDPEPACVIALSAEDFVALFEGRANGQQLFFSGRLRIRGDLGQAYKLRELTDLLR